MPFILIKKPAPSSTAVRIDWLTITCAEACGTYEAMLTKFGPHVSPSKTHELQHNLYIGSGANKSRVGLSVRGKLPNSPGFMVTFNPARVNYNELRGILGDLGIDWGVLSETGRVSRCDVALDVFGLVPSDYFFLDRRKTLVTAVHRGGRRETTYIGSRSARWSIYDKKKQMKVMGEPWLRIEHQRLRWENLTNLSSINNQFIHLEPYRFPNMAPADLMDPLNLLATKGHHALKVDGIDKEALRLHRFRCDWYSPEDVFHRQNIALEGVLDELSMLGGAVH